MYQITDSNGQYCVTYATLTEAKNAIYNIYRFGRITHLETGDYWEWPK